LTLVVDASVALKWAINEPGSENAAELVTLAMIAPSLFQAEVGHVLTKSVRRARLSVRQARVGFDRIMQRVALSPIEPLGNAALELSLALRHSIHDCYYLAAAETTGRPYVTADAVFVMKLREIGRGRLVYLLGEEVPVG
jgi:predicted nucleic acid-binding protein